MKIKFIIVTTEILFYALCVSNAFAESLPNQIMYPFCGNSVDGSTPVILKSKVLSNSFFGDNNSLTLTTIPSLKDKLIVEKIKKWPNGSTLKYALDFTGVYISDFPYVCKPADTSNICATKIINKIQNQAGIWSKYGNIYFEYTNDWNASDIRIGFIKGDGAYSLVGTDANHYKSSITMNLDATWWTDSYLDITITHEFGHAIGFKHEHQRSDNIFLLDEAATYSFYEKSQGWSQQDVYDNVLDKFNVNSSAYGLTGFDYNSVMIYWIPKEIIINKELCPSSSAFYCVEDPVIFSELDQAGVREFYPPDQFTVSSTGDLNGDSKPDILWRNFSTGENSYWYMNGVNLISGGYIQTVYDLNWDIVGMPDLNGDGKPDILWRNSKTGENSYWYMNGVDLMGTGYIQTVYDLNWIIVGTPDLNGDGKPDILWRNVVTGENSFWYMNGVNPIDTGYIQTVYDLNWAIVGTPDLNGDGKVDILWQNSVTGENSYWYMNGVNFVSGGYIQTVYDLNWDIVGTPDLNGDGRVDILWRNSKTGENSYWYMDGLNIISTGYLQTVYDLNWHIVGF